MATFKSRQVAKKHTNRGVTSMSEQSVGGYFLLDTAKTTGDVIQMVRMGEDTRPTTIKLWARNKSGALTLSTAAFSVGVQSVSASNFTRADGKVYTPVATSAVLLSASMDLATDGYAETAGTLVAPGNKGYAPYYITLTPLATVTPTGAHELIMEVQFQGEEDVDAPAYTSFP